MSNLVESIATILILIFIILLVTHSLNGTATEWISSKFHVGDTGTTDTTGSSTTGGGGGGAEHPT